jgi:hypothetical protein
MLSPIDWQEHPAPIAPGSRLDLIRCKLGATVPVVVLSERQVGTEIHWYNGRSFPHLKNGCPACLAKRPAVWKGYLAVWQPKPRTIAIIEFTTRCTNALDAYFLAYGTLRAATVVLTRKGRSDKGPLTLDISPSQYATNDLPPAPDIRHALTHMWNASRQDDDIDLTPPRPVVEPPMNNDELRRRRPDRFAPPDPNHDDELIQTAFATTRETQTATPRHPTHRNGQPK